MVEIDDSNFASITSQAYDVFGRLTQVASPQGVVNYGYDAAGRQIRTWTSHGVDGSQLIDAITDTRSTYDVLGRLKDVDVVERNNVAVTENKTEYRYDNNGNLHQVELPNGVIADYTYDALNRLTRLRHFEDVGVLNNQFDSGEPVLADFAYTVRTDGQRAKAVETNDQQLVTTIDWLYDALGRLTEERYDADGPSNDFIARYAFDLAGNRALLSKDEDNADPLLFVADEIIDYLYDSNDRLTREKRDMSVGDSTTFYDHNGTEQIAKTVYEGLHETDPGGAGTKTSATAYGYNVRGRLETVAIDSDGNGTANQAFTYEYDDGRNRVSSHDSLTGDTTIYLVDSSNHTGYAQVLEEGLDANSDGRLDVTEIGKTYTLGHDVIAQQAPDLASGNALFLLYDGHGSTRALLDPDADVLESYAYEAYGNAIGFDPGAALTSLLYSGEQTDQTGLQYLRDRYLDPATGRFLSFDAFAGNTSDPLSLHKYLYTHANPVMGVDPSGMFEGLVGLGAASSIGAMLNNLTATSGQIVAEGIEDQQAAMQSFQFSLAVFAGGAAVGVIMQFGDDIFARLNIFQQAFEQGSDGLRGFASRLKQVVIGGSSQRWWPKISPVATDWATKGAHILVEGVELGVRPGEGGSIVFKPFFSTTAPGPAAKAIKIAEKALEDRAFRQRLYNATVRGVDFLKTGDDLARARSGELRFLAIGLEKLGI